MLAIAVPVSCRELAALLATQLSDSDDATNDDISYSPKVSPIKGNTASSGNTLGRVH